MSFDLSEDGVGTIAQRMAAHYAGVTHRLRGAPPVHRVRVRAPVEPDDLQEPTPTAAERDFLFVSLPTDPDASERRVLLPQWRVILSEVAQKHKVSIAEIKGPQRNPYIVSARHEAFYRMAHETTMSLPTIGRRMGGKDHTTVLHGMRKHALRNGLELGKRYPGSGKLGPGGWAK